MPELLVVHEFARRASAYITLGAQCIVIFNTKDLQKKKNTERQVQGYLIYDQPEEIYLRYVYHFFPFLFLMDSIGRFLQLNLCFLRTLPMKSKHHLFLWNLVATSYFLLLLTFTFDFFLHSMVKLYLVTFVPSNKSKIKHILFNLLPPLKRFLGNALFSFQILTPNLLFCWLLTITVSTPVTSSYVLDILSLKTLTETVTLD